MKRARKGTTRTGAIPFCMAEVTPQRSREARIDRAMSALCHEGNMYRERLLFAVAPPAVQRFWFGVGEILAVAS